MAAQIKNGVKVSVETYYQPQYSRPMEDNFMFAYRITIENFNDYPVQLISRRWEIFDSNGDLRTVEGEGVVGRQPVLEQDESHQYVSGCNLQTEIGRMHGSYTFESKLDGERFEVRIPAFELWAPSKLN